STFLTFGVGSALNAADTASATAGFSKEEEKDPKKADDGGFKYGDSAFDKIFDKIADKYGTANATGGAGADKTTLQLAGAFAFSYTDHKAKTLITGTADLNSNDDMELTSGISEELKLTAEATGEEQPGKK